ncbi:MAG: hypothetical protein ACJ754_08105 [Pyrinomonadaceae bacterium]
MKNPQPKQPKSDEFTRFEQTLRNLIAVPKSEVDKEKAKYDERRAKEKGQPRK